jgi:hypothetical protein
LDAVFGHITKFFFVFLGEEQRTLGWFIWSKSACYSPARAHVYNSMGMNIHQPASQPFSIPSHTAARDVADARRNLRVKRIWGYGWWLCASSPSFLLVSLSSFTLPFTNDEWALQFLFFTRVACC